MALADVLCVVRGGGDLATGVAFRLHRAGFPVVVTELAQPLAVRRAVAFAEAVYSGYVTVDGVVGRLVDDPVLALAATLSGEVAVMVDPDGRRVRRAAPFVIVDGRMAKSNRGTSIHDADLVIGLGPGLLAGRDCHAVVETNRGHYLGRVIWEGSAQPDTGLPEPVSGFGVDRVLRAPRDGRLRVRREIGDQVVTGAVLAEIDGEPVVAPFEGVLRGIVHDGLSVAAGTKIGDLDPRGVREYCFAISDKALAVGGGVLEAVLSWPGVRLKLEGE